MSGRISLFLCVATILCTSAPAQIFEETWDSATVGVYAPGSTIDGDEGFWFVGDSISEAPDCGVSPQAAEIVTDGSNRAVLLRSIESGTVCPDDVFVALTGLAAQEVDSLLLYVVPALLGLALLVWNAGFSAVRKIRFF